MDTPVHDTLLTLKEFENLPDDGFRTELVRGRLVREPPAGMDHGWIGNYLAFLITDLVLEHDLGKVFGADTGFVLFEKPPTVRAPDVAFVASHRLPPPQESPGLGRLAPDLAVEILSPSNKAIEILDKVEDYLESGTRLVWVVEPRRRSVTVYRSRNEIRLLRENEELDGADVLPGFSIRVSDIFSPSTAG